MTEEDPFSRVSVKMLIGNSEYLDEHGSMPDPVVDSGIPVIVPPDNEELEDPPGRWTAPDVLVGNVYEMQVYSKRAAYVWLPAWHFMVTFVNSSI